MEVVIVLFEMVISEIAPEDGKESEMMSGFEGLCDFLELSVGVLGPPVDGGADTDGAHIVGIFDGAVEDLVVLIGIGEELVVVDFNDIVDFVSEFSGVKCEDAEGGGYGVALSVYGELYDIIWIEVIRVRCEGGSCGVFDALVYGEDGEISGACESS